MIPSAESSLAHTENKRAVRQLWDRPILSDFSSTLQGKLRYFGLPGPEIQDFFDWGDLLGWKTVVDVLRGSPSSDQYRQDLRRIGRLEKNLLLNGHGGAYDLRKGELEQVVLTGTDMDGNRPRYLEVSRDGKSLLLQYELHNWDFQGGLGYITKNRFTKQHEAKRIKAIEQCIRMQRGHSFAFLLTLNVRHKLASEPSDFLRGLGSEYGSEELVTILGWFANQSAASGLDRCRTAVTVPALVRDFARMASFDCRCFPAVYYEGYGGEHLIHFVFILTPTNRVLPAHSCQSLHDVVHLPLLEATPGKIMVADVQHPLFDLEKANQSLLPLRFQITGEASRSVHRLSS